MRPPTPQAATVRAVALAVGWLTTDASDAGWLPTRLAPSMHAVLVAALVVMSVAVGHASVRTTDRGYAQGVVDGLRLAAARSGEDNAQPSALGASVTQLRPPAAGPQSSQCRRRGLSP